METNRIFLWISRINSVLFLLLLLLGIGLALIGVVESIDWHDDRAVEVVKSDKKPERQEHLRLGSLNKVCGHDVKYVELQTEGGGKFASSGGGGQTRNAIFFTGDSNSAHWLFDTNQYLIENINTMPYNYGGCEDDKVSVIYYDVVMQDSNHDGKLSNDDAHTIAISSPSGRNYRELITGATKVLGYELTDNDKKLSFLLQLDKTIIMRDYSLDGELLTEIPITELSGR
jgi:hypothetical protein